MENTINDRFKEVRIALKLSQRDFSKGIFLTQGSYARIEQGVVNINDRIIELVCTIYKVNKTYLKDGAGAMFSESSADPRLEHLYRIFNELNNVYQDYLLIQAKELLNVQKKHESAAGKGGKT